MMYEQPEVMTGPYTVYTRCLCGKEFVGVHADIYEAQRISRAKRTRCYEARPDLHQTEYQRTDAAIERMGRRIDNTLRAEGV